MVDKLARFKARAAAHGQTVSLYRYQAHPAGAGVNAQSGYPDPEDPAYPATVPTVTYAAPVTVTGFMQARRSIVHGGAAEYRNDEHGPADRRDMVFFAPGDQAVGLLDKVVWNGQEYVVDMVVPWADGAQVVNCQWYLREKLTP